MNDGTTVSTQLADAAIVWYYETMIDEELFIIEISKGGAIDQRIEWTEEEYEYLQSIEGQWHISGYGYTLEYKLTYTEKLNQLDDSLVENHPIYLIGGLKMIQYPVALVTRDDHPEALVPLEKLLIADSSKNEVYNDQSHADYKENSNPLEYKDGAYGENVIDFEAMQKVANSADLTNTTSGPGVIDLNNLTPEEDQNVTLLVRSFLGISAGLVLLSTVVRKRRAR